MNKEQVMSDEGMVRRFQRDYKIPITIYRSDLFLERCEMYSQFKPRIQNALSDLFDMMEKLTSVQEFFEKYNIIKDSIISSIKESDGYKSFNEEEMNQFQVVSEIRDLQLPSKDIFKPSNVGKLFLSFDMVKGNFSSLQHYDRKIFNNKDLWEEFVVDFTPSSMKYYITNSKYLREVVLGNCNPKRHITYEKYLMSLILKDILQDLPYVFQKVEFFSNDEVVFRLDNMEMVSMLYPYFDHNSLDIPFRMEVFKLRSLGDNVGYVKEDLEDKEAYQHFPFSKFEFKGVNNFCMPFVLRRMLGENVTDNDRLFIHPNEGLLSKFIEEPQISISEDLQAKILEARQILRDNDKESVE